MTMKNTKLLLFGIAITSLMTVGIAGQEANANESRLEIIQDIIQNPTTEYYTAEVTVPKNQEIMVSAVSELLSVIDNTENQDTKKLYQQHLETNLTPIMAEYGVFLTSKDIKSSNIPTEDRHKTPQTGSTNSKKAFKVKAWVEYNCEPIKCTTQKVVKYINAGNLFNVNGVIGNFPSDTFGADMEFHHEVTNVNSVTDKKIKTSHWGTFKDYSERMNVNCIDSDGDTPIVKHFKKMYQNRAYDIRYCEVDDIEYGDRFTQAIKIGYYR